MRFPKGSIYRGAVHPRCAAQTLLLKGVAGELHVVGGIPIFLRDLRGTAGRGDWLAVSRPPTAIGAATVLGPPRG